MKVILAEFGFNITTPGMKTNYRSAALPTALSDPANMHACMYMCVRAQVYACLSVRVCGRRTDRGWRDGGFKCVHVCTCVSVCTCVRPCLRACDPVCEAGLIDARVVGK